MIFKTLIDQPSSRHPYSGWDHYRSMLDRKRPPPKSYRVHHAAVIRPARSRATSRHTVGVNRPDRLIRRGPSHLSASKSGSGPLIQLF